MKAKVLWLFLANLTLATAQTQVIPAQLYQKVVDRGYEMQEVITRLADYYYGNRNTPHALKYYQKLTKGIGYYPEPIAHYRYASLLQKSGKAKEAQRQMLIFQEEATADFTKQPSTAAFTPDDLMGVVTDMENGNILSGAIVSLVDVTGATFVSITDESGIFSFPAAITNFDFQHAYIEIVKENYEVMAHPITIATFQQKTYSLSPHTFVVNKGDNLANVLAIDNIHFDFGQTNIRQDASVQLTKILVFLQENPSLKMNIKVHTDSRGDDDYNMNLTEVQAKSIEKWLLKNGISPQRITCKGYGETQLVNGCTDGMHCSEEEHQANKRVEFIID